MQTFKNNRSLSEAIEIAKKATDFLPIASRSNVTVDENNVSIVCGRSSRSTSTDTLLYAVNYSDGQGFVLVSAPESVEPIIAITESGTFDSDETKSNANFQYALESAKQYIQSTVDENADLSKTTFSMLPTGREINELQSPRVTVQWGQLWPENLYCPNDIAGCAPVAIAQVCSYFSEPSQIELTFAERDKDLQVLDWLDMKRHIKTLKVTKQFNLSDTFQIHAEKDSILFLNASSNLESPANHTCLASDSAHYEIGRFIRQIGVIAKSRYYDGGTGTYREDIPTAAKTLLPNRQHTSSFTDDANGFYDLLKSGGVALIIADLADGTAGHAWVADATGKIGTLWYKYERDDDGNLYVASVSEDVVKYIHYNWGWNGDSNGYFSVNTFKTNDGYKYDNTDNTKSYDLSKDIEFIHIK
jgi:hypothetical protein